MSEKKNPLTQVDTVEIKPLNDSPFMSANCWQAIADAVKLRGRSGDKVRVLEWGGGNSTIAFLEAGLHMRNSFELVSIDHATSFFPWLAEALISVLVKKGRGPFRVSWQPLRGPMIPVSHLPRVLEDRKMLSTRSLTWQILLGNRRWYYTEQFEPQFYFSPLKILRQAVKLFLIELSYWLWVVRGVVRNVQAKSFKERYGQGVATFSREANELPEHTFLKYFKKNPVPGCLTIQQENLMIQLWHLPEIRTPLMQLGVVFDGPYVQLPDYVGVSLENKFDIIFVDGRARVSCLKRIHRDRLLKDGGWLFAHDAFRSESAEGFRLFSPAFKFIRGSNSMLNGQKRCSEQFGPPFIQTGVNLDTLEWELAQELFVYQNNHEPQPI